MVRTYCRIGNILNSGAHLSRSPSVAHLDQTSCHNTIQYALQSPTGYTSNEESPPLLHSGHIPHHPDAGSSPLPPTSLDAPPTANGHPAHLQFPQLGWTTPPKMDLPENGVFNHNFDLAFLTRITLIIMDLIVLVCLILPPAILLVGHAFRIAIPTARITIWRVRRIRARRWRRGPVAHRG